MLSSVLYIIPSVHSKPQCSLIAVPRNHQHADEECIPKDEIVEVECGDETLAAVLWLLWLWLCLLQRLAWFLGVVRGRQYDSLPVAELKSQKFAQLTNKGETSQAAFLRMP